MKHHSRQINERLAEIATRYHLYEKMAEGTHSPLPTWAVDIGETALWQMWVLTQ